MNRISPIRLTKIQMKLGLFDSNKAEQPYFNYGADLVKAGEAGLVWDATNIVEYSADPRAFLRTYLDDNKAKSKMAFKLNKGGEDVAAYLASVAPAPES